MEPIALKGQHALPAFRLNALLELLRSTCPGLDIESVSTSFVYFLDVQNTPSQDDMGQACALLDTDQPFKETSGFFVTPRKGTISPWSSKATDIFHNCGLTTILRAERGIHYRLKTTGGDILDPRTAEPALPLLHDRMTEGVYIDITDIFQHMEPAPFREVDILGGGRRTLDDANITMGLALSGDEIDYLCKSYQAIQRNPTDVELVMFGQVNSEHCRHKIFNADWIIDGSPRDTSLFNMIRNTHREHPAGTLVAYSDNSGVIEGPVDTWFEVARDESPVYHYAPARMDILLKVETHNHPTAIAPFPGAATGVGGEIRDEAATGTGGKSKAGLSAFFVSNLRVPGFIMPWERVWAEFPTRLATPLDIMIDGPLGGAAFGNEFGRPQLCGLFRTYEQRHNNRYRGYHKPIMVAGGMGNIKRTHVEKKDIPAGAAIIQLGGPALRIGLGGGAASSMATGSNAADLDFDSVQRDNAEMQRRCQEVIDTCIAMEDKNPILSIHDIGAGGLSNGCPELVAKTGGSFELRNIHNEELSMSPMEIWCCEAQERYVLAVSKDNVENFLALCERERCPVAVIGHATDDGHLTLSDSHFNNKPIDIDVSVILGKPPKMLRDVKHSEEDNAPLALGGLSIMDAAERVLQLPCIARKTFLITITDRTVSGLVTRDQMTGPYQTPISDVAVTVTSHKSYTGEAMAMGERTPVAMVDAPASGRLAVGEALTNIASANVGSIGNIKLSANWMCACGEAGEDAKLFDTVKGVGMVLCPELGVAIPVGKDSLSMRTIWQDSRGKVEKMTAPLSLVISAFSPVADVRKTVTPDLKPVDNSSLILVDLGEGKNRLACSSLAQVTNQVGSEPPDMENPKFFRSFFAAIQELISENDLLAYHDRSDGGLFVTLSEMAFGGRRGINVSLDPLGDSDPVAILFSEELGAVLQVDDSKLDKVMDLLAKHGLGNISHRIGSPATSGELSFMHRGKEIFRRKISELNRLWSELTYRMQARRDNPESAKQEYDSLLDENDPGMSFSLTFDPDEAFTITGTRPRMAILREQGINGQVEMAAAFDRAGFLCQDVHMTDLIGSRVQLDDFAGLVACGGFSYGDVLGAGSGWAKSIMFNEQLKDQFARFFDREETFTLGICNGCQMVSQLKSIIPGASDWPEFSHNTCERFEARYVTVEILPSPSIFFKDMYGSRLGIPVAHGEGRADFDRTGSIESVISHNLVTARYVDNYGKPTEQYPFNPNGSPGGMTGLTTLDGRVTILMPHPERVFRSIQLSYRPGDIFKGEAGPWLRMFQNARTFVG